MDTTVNAQDYNRMGIALLMVRIAAALAFLYHGSAVLFGAFGGPGIAGFAQYSHVPVFVAFLVGLAQFGGGLAMLTGVFARLGAAGIIAVMLGAIFMVHLSKGFDITKGGMEYALTQLLIAVGILIAGAGPYSLASILKPVRRETRVEPPLTTNLPQH